MERMRIRARRRNRLRGSVKITPDSIDFGIPTNNNDVESAISKDDSTEGASCAASNSRQNEGKEQCFQRIDLVSAACQADIPALKKGYEYEMTRAGGDFQKISVVQNQISNAMFKAVLSKDIQLVSSILDIVEESVIAMVPQKFQFLCEHAVKTGSEELLDLFIKRGILLAIAHHTVLLHFAARIINTAILRKLLNFRCFDVNKKFNGQTPLHVSLVHNNNDCARMLLNEGSDINIKDNLGKTALHEAAIRGNEAMVQQLLSLGADPDLCDSEGKTPWFCAMMHNHSCTANRIVQELPKNHLGLPKINGNTMLHIAIKTGFTHVVKILLDMDCDPVGHDGSGNTPLMTAVSGRFLNSDIIKLLLKSDAVRTDINYESKRSETALSLIFQYSYILKHNHIVVIDMLLEAGADINQELNHDETILMRHFMNEEMREIILEKGGNARLVTSSGKSVLWVLCNHGSHLGEVQHLLDNNLDMRLGHHVYKPTGTTPFMQSMQRSTMPTLQLLYAADCSPKGLDKWVLTPYGSDLLLRKPEHKEIVDTIENNGDLNRPMSLWRQARLAVLGGMAYGKIEDKIDKLGLPSNLSSLLIWKNYCKDKTKKTLLPAK